MADTTTDVLVAGAGPVGLAAALALAQAGRHVSIRDAAARPATGAGRLWAINQPARELLGRLQAWPTRGVVAVRRMHLAGAACRPATLDAAAAGRGALCCMVEEAGLLDALRAAADRAGLAPVLAAPVRAVAAAPGHVDVTCGAGARVRTRLLVGADGMRSAVAGLAGLGLPPAATGRAALAARVTLPGLADDAAWQWLGPAGTLALLPGPEHRACIIWAGAQDAMQALRDLGRAAFLAELARRCGPPAQGATDLGARVVFPLVSGSRPLAGRRVALAGDAGRAFHPLAGQGLSLGLGDVAVLATLAGQRDPGSDRVLGAYRRRRALRGNLTVGLTAAVARLADSPAGGRLLDALLRLPGQGALAWAANQP